MSVLFPAAVNATQALSPLGRAMAGLAFFLLGAAAWSAEFESGLNAFKAGDFQRARALWESGVDKGDVRSHYGLGVLYNEGKGVVRNHATAALWFRNAARQNLADAQMELGFMRAIGRDGVRQDAVQAYVWFQLAARNGHPQAAKHRDLVAGLLTDDERQDARYRLDAWSISVDLQDGTREKSLRLRKDYRLSRTQR